MIKYVNDFSLSFLPLNVKKMEVNMIDSMGFIFIEVSKIPLLQISL